MLSVMVKCSLWINLDCFVRE